MLEIGRYNDTVDPVPTEEEAAEYLAQLALEEEEEQTLLSRFSGEEDIRDWHVFRVMKYKNFHNTNQENKTYDRMSLLSVYISTAKFTITIEINNLLAQYTFLATFQYHCKRTLSLMPLN